MLNVRQIAGCIPVLLAPFQSIPPTCPSSQSVCPVSDRPSLHGSQFLMINSRKHPNSFVFPKGGLKDGEDPMEAAVRETLEETGIEGEVFDRIDFEEPKDGTWFLLRVTKIHDDWKEKDQRTRIWVDFDKLEGFGPIRKRTRNIIRKLTDLYTK